MIKQSYLLLIIIAAVLIIRLILSTLPGFEIDQNVWRYWAIRLAEVGSINFYSKDVFTDYTPGFLYFLWVIGLFWKNNFEGNFAVLDFFIKIPMVLFDIATGLLIYKIVLQKTNLKLALTSFLVYTLNPLVVFNASIWGQFDGITTFIILLAFYLAYTFPKKFLLPPILLGIAWAMKPQIISFLPFYGLFVLINSKIKNLIMQLTIFLFTFILIYWPFFPSNPFSGFFYVNKRLSEVYNCTTCFGFNFWGIFGNWGDDFTKFLNIQYVAWGIILTAINLAIIFFVPKIKHKFSFPYFYLTASLSIMASCIFLTRMHERYIFPSIAFLLIAAMLQKSKVLFTFFVVFSILFTLNIYAPFAYYGSNISFVQYPLNLPYPLLLTDNFKLMSSLVVVTYLSLLGFYIKLMYKK